MPLNHAVGLRKVKTGLSWLEYWLPTLRMSVRSSSPPPRLIPLELASLGSPHFRSPDLFFE